MNMDLVTDIASRALAAGADPAAVVAFLRRAAETPEEEFGRLLHEAQAAR